jgi:hypothetical protein
MERNAKESPLLRLPAELRNRVFRLVVGDQHVHISVGKLPERFDTDHDRAISDSITSSFVDQFGGGIYCSTRESGRYDAGQRMQQPTCNTIYPLEWRHSYDSVPLVANEETAYLSKMVPNERVVYDSGSHMTIFSATCRQIHQEVVLLPYSTNEFSFESPYALNKWLNARYEAQARAVKTIWVDIEWSAYPPLDTCMDLLALPQATLKVSKLTWKAVSAAFWAKNKDLGQCAIADFDRDIDIWAEMEDWLHRSCGKLISRGQLKVEYVKE